jgi:alcohol dehydrogenase
VKTVWTFHTASGILFGMGALEHAGTEIRRLGYRQVFLITDGVLAEIYLDRVSSILREAGVEMAAFAGGEPEPSFRACEEALAAARQFKCDAIVALGGGSNIDLAKAVSILLAHGGQIADYVGENRVPGPCVPVVAISTTAGTGSEVSGASVLSDQANHVKVGILDNHIRPVLAVYDPLLTVSCPSAVTADSGLDALTHAVEGYNAVEYPYMPQPGPGMAFYQGKAPITDLLCEEAIRLLGRWLPLAYLSPRNLEARQAVHLASLIAGMGFSNAAVTACHALEYAIGPAAHISHGRGNAILLPYVMEFNLPARPVEYARMAHLLGEPVVGLSETEAGMRAVAAVRRLRSQLGIPDRLRDVGINQADIPVLAERAAMAARILRCQPRKTGVKECEEILQMAW